MARHRVKIDVGVATASQLLEKVAALVVLMVLTRAVSAEEMGTYFFAVSLAGLLAIFSALGTTTALVRATAQEPTEAGRLLGGVLSVRLPLMALAGAGIVATAWLVVPERAVLIGVSAVYALLVNLCFSFGAVLAGLRRVRLRSVLMLVGPGLAVLWVPAAVWGLGLSVEGVVAGMAGAAGVMVGGLAWATWRAVGFHGLALTSRSAWAFAMGSWPFLAMTALRGANFRLDTVMVFGLAGAAQAAAYETAFKVMEVTQLLMRPISLVFFPLCTAYAAQVSWVRLSRTAVRLGVLAGLGGLAVGVSGAVAAPWVMPVVWGDGYAAYAGVMRVLMLAVPVLWLTLVGSFLAASLGLERRVAVGQAVALMLNVGANAVVVPRLGAQGAAWTTLGTQGLLGIWLLLLLWLTLGRRVRGTTDFSAAGPPQADGSPVGEPPAKPPPAKPSPTKPPTAGPP